MAWYRVAIGIEKDDSTIGEWPWAVQIQETGSMSEEGLIEDETGWRQRVVCDKRSNLD